MYRVVATDSRSPRDGRFLENLGWYKPLDKPAKISLNVDRTIHWLREGAQPSNTMATLFKQVGLSKIWEMAQRGEDYSGESVAETIQERPHKVKSKARARMKEAAGVEESGEAKAEEKPAEVAEETKAEEPAADAAEEKPAK
jgi:small subunit ribosomal protein S16